MDADAVTRVNSNAEQVMGRELLIGCGSNRQKKCFVAGHETWQGLITLDHNADHNPDVIWDLEQLPIPFEDNYFDEIHAYEVLEHTGQQGDWRFFFAQWSDFWRVLKPAGLFVATVPMWTSIWAWGDPSHKRVINSGSLTFLSQAEYRKQVGHTALSDFRFCYQADFERVFEQASEHEYIFVLKANKPPLASPT